MGVRVLSDNLVIHGGTLGCHSANLASDDIDIMRTLGFQYVHLAVLVRVRHPCRRRHHGILTTGWHSYWRLRRRRTPANWVLYHAGLILYWQHMGALGIKSLTDRPFDQKRVQEITKKTSKYQITSKIRITVSLQEDVTYEWLIHKRPIRRKVFPCHDVITKYMTS